MGKKRLIVGLVIITIMISFTGCREANVKNVVREIGSSSRYTEDDINQAMDEVVREFRTKFKGCTLTKLWYVEDNTKNGEDEDGTDDTDYAGQKASPYGSQGLIILSEFTVDKNGDAEHTLNPNDTYSGWKWIMKKDTDGNWIVKDNGLG